MKMIEDEQTMVEYESQEGRKVYEGAERHIDDDEDFSDKINIEDLPPGLQDKLKNEGAKKVKELPEKALNREKPNGRPGTQTVGDLVKRETRGSKGFEKLDKSEREEILRQRIKERN